MNIKLTFKPLMLSLLILINLTVIKTYASGNLFSEFFKNHKCFATGITSTTAFISIMLIHQGMIKGELNDVKRAVKAIFTLHNKKSRKTIKDLWNDEKKRTMLMEVITCLISIGLIPIGGFLDRIIYDKSLINDANTNTNMSLSTTKGSTKKATSDINPDENSNSGDFSFSSGGL